MNIDTIACHYKYSILEIKTTQPALDSTVHRGALRTPLITAHVLGSSITGSSNCSSLQVLTHFGENRKSAILNTTYSNTFSSMKMVVLCLKFQCSWGSSWQWIGIVLYTLHWHHIGRNCVCNHQPHDCLLKRLFRRRSKKTSKLCVTGLCVGNSPGRGKCFHLMTSSWMAWRQTWQAIIWTSNGFSTLMHMFFTWP